MSGGRPRAFTLPLAIAAPTTWRGHQVSIESRGLCRTVPLLIHLRRDGSAVWAGGAEGEQIGDRLSLRLRPLGELFANKRLGRTRLERVLRAAKRHEILQAHR